MGAATKSSSAESSRATAGRNLPPGVWWKSIRIRTTSPGRSVMDQKFIDRVVGSVGRLELPSASRAPGSVVVGHAPLEYDLNLLPRRNLRRDLMRNRDLAVRREFAHEVSSLHLRSLILYISSRVRKIGAARTLYLTMTLDKGEGPGFWSRLMWRSEVGQMAVKALKPATSDRIVYDSKVVPDGVVGNFVRSRKVQTISLREPAVSRIRSCISRNPLRSRLRSAGIDAQLAHLGLQRGALHAEFGGGAGVPAHLAPGVVERALDGLPFGGFQGLGPPAACRAASAHRPESRPTVSRPGQISGSSGWAAIRAKRGCWERPRPTDPAKKRGAGPLSVRFGRPLRVHRVGAQFHL